MRVFSQLHPRHSHLARAFVITLAFAAGLTLAGRAVAQPMLDPAYCDRITFSPTSPVAGDDVTMCGPEGIGFTYTWTGPGIPADTHTRCVTLNDLAAGTYDFEFTVSHGDSFRKCPVHLVVGGTSDLVCPEVPTICAGTPTEICGQSGDGLTYTWTGDGIVGEVHTRCITVTLSAGAHSIHYVVSRGEEFRKCDLNFTVEDCAVNCPRTVGFWTQQCKQRGNGSTKFSVSQMNQITACVDERSTFFDWGTDFSSFCAAIDPSGSMTQRNQAVRQYAAFLANICTGELGLATSNGDSITLDLETSFTCGGLTLTLEDFLARTDSLLVYLGGQSSSDSRYGALIACLDSINNGNGIGATCSDEDDDDDDVSSLKLGRGALSVSNPNSAGARLEFSVGAGDRVKLAVFDVAGRQIKVLADGFLPAGRQQIDWDGRSDAGASVRPGVYFVKGQVGAQAVSSRVLVLK